MSRKKRAIYTHLVAADIVDEFEFLLMRHDIYIPDADRTGEESEAHIYGDTYSELLDSVEWYVSNVLKEMKKKPRTKIVEGVFG